MKQIILAVVLLFVSVRVSASTYGIRGGILVTGTAVGSPVFVPLGGGRDLFLSEADCNDELHRLLRMPVTRASAKTSGDFSATEEWAKANPVTKFNLASCGKMSQY